MLLYKKLLLVTFGTTLILVKQEKVVILHYFLVKRVIPCPTWGFRGSDHSVLDTTAHIFRGNNWFTRMQTFNLRSAYEILKKHNIFREKISKLS